MVSATLAPALVNVAPTPEFARLVMVNPVPLVNVVISAPPCVKLKVTWLLPLVENTKYAVPAVNPFDELSNTITSSTFSAGLEPNCNVFPPVISVTV